MCRHTLTQATSWDWDTGRVRQTHANTQSHIFQFNFHNTSSFVSHMLCDRWGGHESCLPTFVCAHAHKHVSNLGFQALGYLCIFQHISIHITCYYTLSCRGHLCSVPRHPHIPPPCVFRYALGDMRAYPLEGGGGETYIYLHILTYFYKLHRCCNIFLFRGSIYDP